MNDGNGNDELGRLADIASLSEHRRVREARVHVPERERDPRPGGPLPGADRGVRPAGPGRLGGEGHGQWPLSCRDILRRD